MINALHLIWIIPLSACFGFFIAALMSVAKVSETYSTKRNNEK
jgi:hypothetical protein